MLPHPCTRVRRDDSDFILNDVPVGGDKSPDTLHRAGKSTLLRMTRIATILAQIGCYVPAESAAISPVDRICTRIGAWFALATFKVEVYDARKFIHEATSKSLVILEELRRDTTTLDGHSLWLSRYSGPLKSCIG